MQMGWGRSSENYAVLAREWYAKLGKSGMEALRNFVGARVADLYHAVEKYEATGLSIDIGSDDGMSDLIHHVVGLGEDKFNAYMAQPKLLARRYREDEYTESFAYCFLEPEPPRTQAEKDQTEKALFQAVEDLGRKMDGLCNSLAEAQGLLSRTMALASILKNDKKSA
jgi:hypothetical protein